MKVRFGTDTKRRHPRPRPSALRLRARLTLACPIRLGDGDAFARLQASPQQGNQLALRLAHLVGADQVAHVFAGGAVAVFLMNSLCVSSPIGTDQRQPWKIGLVAARIASQQRHALYDRVSAHQEIGKNRRSRAAGGTVPRYPAWQRAVTRRGSEPVFRRC